MHTYCTLCTIYILTFPIVYLHHIDACLAAKVEHVVMLGNMGGYRGSKLNDIGRRLILV